MKNLYYCLTSMLLSIVMINMVNAQGLRVNSGYLVTKSGYVKVNGAVHNSGTILGNNANIYLSGDWNNPGTFTPGTSSVVFNGSGNQTVSKASGELFKNLSVSKSGGSLLFQHYATISGNLQMNSGMVNTQGNILFLTGAGQLVNEHSGSYVLGIVDVNPSVGSGSSNFSGCGVTMNSGADDIGVVNFRRYNGPNWRVTIGAHSGINRLWQISSTSPPSSGRTLTFTWLADDDNGRNLSQAQIWKSTNNGNLWVKVGPVQDASATHSVTLSGETTFGMYTISDGSNPLGCVLTCPSDINVNNTPGQCGAIVTFSPQDNGGCLNIASTPASGSFFNVGQTTVTVTASDAIGNTQSCSFTVTVTDNENPTITCPGNINTVMDAGSCFATVSLGTPTTNDNCLVSSVTSNKPANNQYPFGVTTVTWTVTDNHGNSATCLQTVTVSDNQYPTISCPTNITANMDANSCYATVSLGTPTTGDNCLLSSVTSNKPANDQYPFGVTTIIWTVTDNHNNSTTCLQTVTVSDNQPPTITCPANITANMDQGSCFATITDLGTPATSDNCLISSTTNDKPANNQYPFGITTVTWTVTDNHGNTSTCLQTVTVSDNQPPTITCPANVVTTMDQGSCFATVILDTPANSDNCQGNSVNSNKPVDNQYPYGTTTVIWTVSDNHGNTVSCAQTVTVSDNQLPTISCPQTINTVMDQGSCFATVSLGTAVTGDNCEVSQVTNNKPANNQYPFGTTYITWVVTDNHGNQQTCVQAVVVTDNQPPSISCPANITANMDANSCFATVSPGSPTTGDNCLVSSVSSNKPANDQYPFGVTTITWTVTDNHGNSSSCAQTVTVIDNQPPVVDCPADLTLNIDQGACYATQLLQSPAIIENCQIQSVANNAPVSNQYPIGTTLITWTVTDNHGNTSSCVQSITVRDNEPPMLVCPGNVGVCANPGNTAVVINGIAPVTAWDRCSGVVTSYEITGVTEGTGLNDASGTSFNVGISTVKYTVVDSYGNTSTCSFTVTIYALPVVSFNNDYAPIALCEPQFQLTGGTPAGGIYTGAGIINNQFQANSAGPGTHVITYVYTDNHGCFGSITFPITVLEPVNTTYTVGTGGDFLNLTGQAGFFNYLNTTSTTGNIIAQVISNLNEPGTVALNPLTVLNDCWNFTVNIVPSAPVVREVTGNTAQAMIRFNGADRVTFNGAVFAGTHFLIRNLDNTQPIVQLSNGATSNTFMGCIFEGANNNAASGLFVFGTSTGTSGNSNNTINQNTFRNRSDYAGLPANMIYSSGSAIWLNTGNALHNNELINFGASGISVTATGNGGNWTMTNNDLYYTISPVSTGNQIAVNFIPGSTSSNNSFNVNTFGGSAINAGGASWNNSAAGTMIGFRINAGESYLNGNTVSNILLSNTGLAHFTGIEINGAGNAVIENTEVSNISVSGTGNFNGIECKGTGSTIILSNTISGISYTATTGSPIIKGIQFKKGNADKNQIFNINCTNPNITPTIYGISNMANGLTTPNQITNNRIAIEAGNCSKPKVFGLYDQSIGIGADFIHNTVLLSGITSNGYYTSAFHRIGNGVVRVYNNILVNRRISTSMAKHYAINCNSTLNYTGNYNDLYTASSSIGNWGGTNHGSFMTWKAMTAQDLNSININPVFVSATDLHLTPANSGIDNKGTPLLSTAVDMDGSPRSLTTPDMGADEFSSILPRIEDPEILITEEPVLSVYPNPSASNTNIEIILPCETNILVEMYNIVGDRVLVLANGTHIAGKHNFTLNADQLPAGSYLIRFVASYKNLVKRLEIIR